jgi:hypothetical protein
MINNNFAIFLQSMKRNIFLLIGSVAIMLCAVSCEKNNKEDLSATTICDTTSVSFANDLVAVIDAKCNTANCHNSVDQAGGYNLVGYDNVKLAIDGGRFQGAINHENNFSQMPKNADKLDACFLLKLNTWIARGSNNN